MSTQQDIYATGSENRPPMLNKDNYVPWSSRIIRYARSRPNGKMIVDSIENGPYIRRMITDIKRMNADDQAIQTIILGLPKDVYAAVDSCETAKEIWERYAGQVAQNQQGYNAWQNGGIQVAQNAGLRVLEWGIKLGATTAEDWEEVGIQLQAEEFNFMVAAGDLDEIEEVNANCILMANLQQASTFGTPLNKAPVYDTDGSAEVQLNDNYYDNEIFNMFTQEEQYTDLLEPIPEPQLVPQNDNHVTFVAPSMVQSGEHQSDIFDIHSDDGNPSRANIKQALGSIKGVTTFSSQIAGSLSKELKFKVSSARYHVVNRFLSESEYVAVSSCCAQMLWIRTQLTDYGFFYDKVPIYCDSKSAIVISCNPEAKKNTQERDRNSRPSVMPSAKSQGTANGSKQKSRRNNQNSRNWPASKSSCKPTGKFFKTIGLRWVPTRKIFNSSTTKVDNKPPNGSNADITNQYECEQNLMSVQGFKEFWSDEQAMTSDHNSLELRIHDHNNELSSSKLVPKVVPPADKTATSRQELESLFYHHITMLRSYKPREYHTNPTSFEEYTPLVTYPKKVEKTFRTLIEVEPLNETKLDEVGLNCNHNTPLSSREVPSFDGLEPQHLLNSPPLDVIFDEKKLGSSKQVLMDDSRRTI
nr:hypothetical protein [Tanacetum cinerariifolium]